MFTKLLLLLSVIHNMKPLIIFCICIFVCIMAVPQRGQESLSSPTASTPALKYMQAPILWFTRTLSLGLRLPRHEAGHPLPYNAEVKNELRCTTILIWTLRSEELHVFALLFVCIMSMPVKYFSFIELTTCIFFFQCHHMSSQTSWSPPPRAVAEV